MQPTDPAALPAMAVTGAAAVTGGVVEAPLTGAVLLAWGVLSCGSWPVEAPAGIMGAITALWATA